MLILKIIFEWVRRGANLVMLTGYLKKEKQTKKTSIFGCEPPLSP